MNIFLLIFVSIIFGVTQKIADALDEHGLVLFRNANLFFGALCGISGALLIILDNDVATVTLAIVLYWIYKKKIDYPNHILAVSLMILPSLFLATNVNLIPAIVLFIFYAIIDFLIGVISKKIIQIKTYKPLIMTIIPIIFGFLVNSYYPLIVTLFGYGSVMITKLLLKHHIRYLNI